jgi:anion-transporting  ArsA/GET3 family ATPase|tara:strand:+ start:6931 stop:7434 length:504 start_codon:yes stop_codon:yes gene_type:complete
MGGTGQLVSPVFRGELMYIPDWSIVKRIQDYDKGLSVKWIDRKERWGIYKKIPSENGLYDKDVLVMVVRNSDDSYRPLDDRALERLRAADQHRLSRINQLHEMREIEEHNEKLTEKRHKETQSEIEDITKDIAPTVRKEMEADVGTRNIPKEDIREDLVSKYGEEVL